MPTAFIAPLQGILYKKKLIIEVTIINSIPIKTPYIQEVSKHNNTNPRISAIIEYIIVKTIPLLNMFSVLYFSNIYRKSCFD